MEALIWTREAPTEPGWYWLRVKDSTIAALRRPHVVNVKLDRYGEKLVVKVFDKAFLVAPSDPRNEGAEWSGPIPHPIETQPKVTP